MIKIEVKGTIVPNSDAWIYRWLGYDATCPRDVNNALEKAAGKDVIVDVNSGGGSVPHGSEIYTALRDYKGNVLIRCVGLAGSAASMILTARESEITPTGLVMIHNASGAASGDYNAMDKKSEILQKANEAIANAYMEKTGLEKTELLDLMNKETWMTADEAVEYGFCDRVIGGNKNNSFSSFKSNSPALLNSCTVLDQETIQKIRNTIQNPEEEDDLSSPQISNDAAGGHPFTIKNNTKKGDNMEPTTNNTITTVEELTASYPSLVQQLVNSAKEEAITNERTRLKSIDEIAKNLSDDIVNDAKYENPVTAEALALQALKTNNEIGNKILNNMVAEIENSGADDVEAQGNSGLPNGKEEEVAESQTKVGRLSGLLGRKS